ncbi:nickel pincer cofactor biosynthesis protein LarC [Nocardia flavorosea]|uniref:Pyridinium-3,5-bisthiocarboxylic acid mononucleotide nickel insertion protein n=1 Tax=Nocardia flavorosea TaxID=53429 RepID=A0A846YLA5_9NOCA|nr:nickel pincer cofactor biosynthesis protein LarC [Nocardia flavorosea]NKY58374.1 nickel pincer cofactor biosynthesis protein LarC [Nocardia flavorosea]
MKPAWLDVSAGVAGDMLLGALVDAGVPPQVVQAAIDAVVPGSVRIECSEVVRCGMRACKVDPVVRVDDPPHRHWSDIRALLTTAALPEAVRTDTLRVFGRLAEAEAGIHGVPVDRVHFHEVGALDSIADIVGACAALHYLGIERVTAGPLSLGSGSVVAAHGTIPVPVPAVLAMSSGRRVRAGGDGELATPTGVAWVTALADESAALPSMRLERVGIGAGTKDFPDRPNVVRVLVGASEATGAIGSDGTGAAAENVVLEANVDDLDPRVWPAVLQRLLSSGADDAWLTPILMKKGRPAHTVHALVAVQHVEQVSAVLLTETSTIGLRRLVVGKTALARAWRPVEITGGRVRIKVALDLDRIIQATPEFDDVAELARATGRPVRVVLDEAVAAAVSKGLATGQRLPDESVP